MKTVTEKGDGQIQVLEEEKQEIQREVSSMIQNPNINTSNNRNGRHYVRCEPCSQKRNVVKMFKRKAKLPSIAQEAGTIFREPVVASHCRTDFHREAIKVQRISFLLAKELRQSNPMGRAILTAKSQLANRIGSLMLHVHYSANRLSLSSNSLANFFQFTNWDPGDLSIDLQYLSPNGHNELLDCIVASHKDILSAKLKET